MLIKSIVSIFLISFASSVNCMSMSMFDNVNQQAVCPETCPEMSGQEEFNFDKFKGVWYTLERVHADPNPSRVFECVQDDFQVKTIEDNLYLVVNRTARPKGECNSVSINGFARIACQNDAKDVNIRFHMSTDFYYDYRYSIATTDYNNFALIYSCVNTNGKNQESAFLLSRARCLDSQLSTLLKGFLKTKYGVDPQRFVPIDHSNCS